MVRKQEAMEGVRGGTRLEGPNFVQASSWDQSTCSYAIRARMNLMMSIQTRRQTVMQTDALKLVDGVKLQPWELTMLPYQLRENRAGYKQPSKLFSVEAVWQLARTRAGQLGEPLPAQPLDDMDCVDDTARE